MKKKINGQINIYAEPEFRGKHVIQLDDEIYTAVTEKKILRILRELKEAHPDKVPSVAYIPKNLFLTV